MAGSEESPFFQQWRSRGLAERQVSTEYESLKNRIGPPPVAVAEGGAALFL